MGLGTRLIFRIKALKRDLRMTVAPGEGVLLLFGGHWKKSLPPVLGEGEERQGQLSDGPFPLQKNLRRQMKATTYPLLPTPPRPTSRCLCPPSPLLVFRRLGSRRLPPPPGQDTELVGAATWRC